MFFFSSNANGGDALSLSIREAVEIGMKQNRKLREAAERLLTSEASLEGERAKYRPKHFLAACRAFRIKEPNTFEMRYHGAC